MKTILKKFRIGRGHFGASTSLWVIAAGLVCSMSTHAGTMAQALSAYDAAITADSTAALAKLTNLVTFDGTAGTPFNFGATSGDTTMEFIVAGDPIATGDSAFLAVGENATS